MVAAAAAVGHGEAGVRGDEEAAHAQDLQVGLADPGDGVRPLRLHHAVQRSPPQGPRLPGALELHPWLRQVMFRDYLDNGSSLRDEDWPWVAVEGAGEVGGDGGEVAGEENGDKAGELT